MIIDTHSHLWDKQDTVVDGQPIRALEENGSRSEFFGEIRQMMPPFMIDGHNTAEVFLSNMDYAQVNAAVVVQEVIDGCQNDYLAAIARRYPDRFKVCAMIEPGKTAADLVGYLEQSGGVFAGVAIPGHRIHTPLTDPDYMALFAYMEQHDLYLSLCLHEDNHQLDEVHAIVAAFPRLRIAIGHFGMVTCPGWMEQIKLAHHENVMVESGGITWLFNSEFYPFHGAIEAIRQAIDEVGADKLMWGSDYPRTITAITYRMSYDFILKTDRLTDEEKRLFLGANAQRFYRFGDFEEIPYIKNMSE